MELLKQRIIKEGSVLSGNILKVDSFLNHKIDTDLLFEMGKEFAQRFSKCKIDKILTIEASGIAVACMAGFHMNVPVVFAKKSEALNLGNDIYTSKVFSYTKNKEYSIKVSKKYIEKNENVLIIDDFLANGQAALGLLDIINQAEAKISGIGIVIEKGFQSGGQDLRSRGINLESLAIIDSLENGEVRFRKEK